MPVIQPMSEIQNGPMCLGVHAFHALMRRDILVCVGVCMIIHIALWFRCVKR